MRIEYTSPCNLQGTLRLKRDPFWFGVGIYEDEDGVKWDIAGVIGISPQPFVQARRVDECVEYYGTGTYDTRYGHHRWLPYAVEVIQN